MAFWWSSKKANISLELYIDKSKLLKSTKSFPIKYFVFGFESLQFSLGSSSGSKQIIIASGPNVFLII